MKRTAIIASLTCLSLTLCAALITLPGSARAGTIDLPRTGQQSCSDSAGKTIACAGTGQDGDKQAGNPWPVPRFTDNNNGTATDNLTGLVWLRNADCFGLMPFNDALAAASTLAGGACGLSDGSKAGDWRVPNINELRSLVDYSRFNPCLTAGHPFYNVKLDMLYRSSSDYPDDPQYSLNIAMSNLSSLSSYGSGVVTNGANTGWGGKGYGLYIWPVRNAQ